MKVSFDQAIVCQSNFTPAVTPGICLPDGSRYERHQNSADKNPQHIVVTGTLDVAQDGQSGCRLVETIRDPEDPTRLTFLDWQDGRWAIVPQLEYRGKVYAPPSPDVGLATKLTLSTGIRPSGELNKLLSDLRAAILEFVEISDRDILLLQSFILANWFPDLFDDVPYLGLIGPLGSAKTKLLKVLSCFCRRALVVGDIRAAALYQLVDSLEPTLLIDELEVGGSKPSLEILRLLRTGSTREIGAVRNARVFSTFGFKVISSRQLPADAALASRFVVISMLPTLKESKVLNRDEMRLLAEKFQPRLLMFRLTHYSAVRRFRMRCCDLHDMTPRTRQVAQVLAAPLEDDPRAQADLIAVLRDQDREMQIDRSLEPEWLVTVALFSMCHERLPYGARYTDILVGGIAGDINKKLEDDGEDLRLGARKVGAVLKSLGMKTKLIGNRGRGFSMNQSFHREVHKVARQLGIDRSYITSSWGLDHGNGGMSCALCQEFGLTAGLQYFVSAPMKPRRRMGNPRVPIFDKVDLDSFDESANADQV
jgi:hypothetical protein